MRLKTFTDPKPGALLIMKAVAGVNFSDNVIYCKEYHNHPNANRPTRPFATGTEIFSILQTVGPGEKKHCPGDRVMAKLTRCDFAKQATVAADFCWPVPVDLAFETAAVFRLPLTARIWHLPIVPGLF